MALFVDASFAGDLEDSKSTAGAILVLIWPNTFVPHSWICEKHGAVSHSSTEAEVIALEAALSGRNSCAESSGRDSNNVLKRI